ncbi:peptide chain release factor 3 [Bacteriovorax stolpii]|uniref:Peptide chain release factor 3 n=1 Tax=Bacteriovorax stolpii TaxID=960 RepID=A0A2K9NS86_BACTC|nr:peptide chain release factor 3 [Bacteriovorax stolpii]AUN98380.1 peptide chain release factor 3 [Bacteriovorax stolpii]QDK41640.1 peptide chain release factor 3 [Bacteriovorax stolpii]TDP50999.1 peptide chain release factor 3 (bRF-3) [Bacteriovorax stolpii]
MLSSMNTAPRCTFAIISHPDAGKTTMTEKLLWFGQVIRETGKVKAKDGNYAKSDWMEIEKERGISISSSVMSFPYNERAMHLLDTPGHKDFSEDTYRTLTAVESVLMMIDSAKGVEAQTIKLMEVCRMRDTPIVTFMNKYDREAMDPFALLENVEKILNIQCVPMTWPIGSGVDFKGVYDLRTKQIMSFKDAKDPFNPIIIDAKDLDSKAVIDFVGPKLLETLKEELELVGTLIGDFSIEEFLHGIQTPVFFGSALNNFGVKETLDMISTNSPGPKPREVKLAPFESDSPTQMIDPQSTTEFTGFIFKIQANMDKKHRDRVAFMRVCSGKFTRNQKIYHVRSEKELKIPTPLMFQAQDREITEEAFPGDIIGLHDTGKFQIGDTFTEKSKFMFTGIPNFAPEIFNKVILKDPMKAKQLEKGLQQLSEEGTVQLFTRHTTGEKILGAVGALQFEVVKYRLEDEYNVNADYEGYSFVGVRWLKFENEKDQDKFMANNSSNVVYDHKKRICFSVRSEWDLKLVMEKNPNVHFFKNSDYR